MGRGGEVKKERGSPQKVEHFLHCFPDRSVRKNLIGPMIQGKREVAFADTEQTTREAKKRERRTWFMAKVRAGQDGASMQSGVGEGHVF